MWSNSVFALSVIKFSVYIQICFSLRAAFSSEIFVSVKRNNTWFWNFLIFIHFANLFTIYSLLWLGAFVFMTTDTIFECEGCSKNFILRLQCISIWQTSLTRRIRKANFFVWTGFFRTFPTFSEIFFTWDVSLYDNSQTQVTANSSAAKDRGWFTDYTSFESKVSDFGGFKSSVIGIGTVELPVEPPLGFVGENSPRILRLTTVLHIPFYRRNFIDDLIINDYKICFQSKETKGFIADQDGQKIAYIDPCHPLCQVKLRNPSSCYYALDHKSIYAIHAIWSDFERGNWYAHQNTLGELFSLQEKIWLKKRFGNEFTFLKVQGLNIYKNEDRENGRTLLRSLMQADKE